MRATSEHGLVIVRARSRVTVGPFSHTSRPPPIGTLAGCDGSQNDYGTCLNLIASEYRYLSKVERKRGKVVAFVTVKKGCRRFGSLSIGAALTLTASLPFALQP